jgi:hypothetical protein
MALLRRHDQPILFFDEVLLYQVRRRRETILLSGCGLTSLSVSSPHCLSLSLSLSLCLHTFSLAHSRHKHTHDCMTAAQDDLEDCGEAAYDVKVRVMPACWFVLARYCTALCCTALWW